MKKLFIGAALFIGASLFAGNCDCKFVDGGVYTAEACPCVLCLPDATIIKEPAPCPKPVVVKKCCPTVKCVVVKPKPACGCCAR